MKKIVVTTGSYNPLTIAHVNLLKNAMSSVKADEGYFIITNDRYLRRKMMTSKSPSSFILNEDVRRECIESLPDSNIYFGGAELGNESPSTERTFRKFQKEHQDSEIYFALGADKIKGLPHWKDIDELLSKIHLIVYSRGDIDVESLIYESPKLERFKDRISVLLSDGYDEISSTEVRRRFFDGEDYSNLVPSNVFSILSKYSPDDFKTPTSEDIAKAQIEVGGRFGGNAARNVIRRANKEIYKAMPKPQSPKAYSEEITIEPKHFGSFESDVLNADCIDVAESLVNNGVKTAILNLASSVKPCGGYDVGVDAQEESLCYASDLPVSLYRFSTPKRAASYGLEFIPNVLSS